MTTPVAIISAHAISRHQVNITWKISEPHSDISSGHVYINGGWAKTISNINKGSIIIDNFSPGMSYAIDIRLLIPGIGTGPASNTVYLTMPAFTGLPAIPIASPSVDGGGTAVKFDLSFEETETESEAEKRDNITGFRIYRDNELRYISNDHDLTDIIDKFLTPGQEHHYQVCAYNIHGETPSSTSFNVTIVLN